MTDSEQAGEPIDELWLDYLEGDLDEAGMASLSHSFGHRPEVRAERIEALRLHRELGLALSATAPERAAFVAATMARLPQGRGQRGPLLGRPLVLGATLGAAIAAAVMAMLLLSPPGAESSRVLRVIAASGPVEWLAGGGQAEPLPGPGADLPGGVLALHGPGAWAELAFRDGTTITLTGIARATVSDEGQKIIALDVGGLTAEVEPQPGAPLLVRTATAVMEVLGTSLRVQASDEWATLHVVEGQVAVTRRADDARVEVAAGESVVATGSAASAFHPVERRPPTDRWKARLKGEMTRGKFVEDTAALKADLVEAVERGELTKAEALDRFFESEGELKAVALWKKRAAERWGTSPKFRGLAGLVASGPVSAGGDSAPVLLSGDSRVLVSGWVATPTCLTLGLTLAKTDRRYAGKVSFTSAVLPGPGAFELEIPAADFQRLQAFGRSEAGAGLSPPLRGDGGSIIEDWWCISHDPGSGLQIHSLEVQGGPSLPGDRR